MSEPFYVSRANVRKIAGVHRRATLEADKRAFVELMRHIRKIDPETGLALIEVGS